MSIPIQATPDSLSAAASEFRTASGNTQELLQTLNALASSLSSSWTGKSHDSFDHLWRLWSKEIQDLCQDLQVIATTLEQGAASYTDVDQQVMPQGQ